VLRLWRRRWRPIWLNNKLEELMLGDTIFDGLLCI
jgi:hypothetical protein